MTPEQEKATFSSPDWSSPCQGLRLREAYWRAKGRPPARRRVSPEAIEAALHRFKQFCRSHRHQPALGELMRQLFEAGRLDQYKLRITSGLPREILTA